ncbi:hypothetical protein LEP1GSC172_3686 [Leptospira noguchii]|uniref:Uncharacterized protein n=1 Tax=Leptospira noguchii TaxID=28182 RepID=M6VXH3_9LEPT|nr:hypothetical protein LEP1GSC172_3686 [Leptospira noguchii]
MLSETVQSTNGSYSLEREWAAIYQEKQVRKKRFIIKWSTF